MSPDNLTPKDKAEVAKFRQFLSDIKGLPRDEFLVKHKEYMGLDDEQLARLKAQEEFRQNEEKRNGTLPGADVLSSSPSDPASRLRKGLFDDPEGVTG